MVAVMNDGSSVDKKKDVGYVSCCSFNPLNKGEGGGGGGACA